MIFTKALCSRLPAAEDSPAYGLSPLYARAYAYA